MSFGFELVPEAVFDEVVHLVKGGALIGVRAETLPGPEGGGKAYLLAHSRGSVEVRIVGEGFARFTSRRTSGEGLTAVLEPIAAHFGARIRQTSGSIPGSSVPLRRELWTDPDQISGSE